VSKKKPRLKKNHAQCDAATRGVGGTAKNMGKGDSRMPEMGELIFSMSGTGPSKKNSLNGNTVGDVTSGGPGRSVGGVGSNKPSLSKL